MYSVSLITNIFISSKNIFKKIFNYSKLFKL